MPKTKTSFQTMWDSCQPFTVVTPYLQVIGFTYEYKLKDDESGDYENVWEPHDLGVQANREIAFEVAKKWRDDLVGVYPIDG